MALMYFRSLSLTLLLVFTANACAPRKDAATPFTSVASDTVVTPISEATPPSLAEVPVEALKGKSQRVNDAVTVKWVVPEIRLDSYVIRYGFDMRNLDYEERVLWGTLRTESDELGRKIFAHTLRGLPPEETIYLSMAGELDGKLSAPSPIFSIQPLAAK